ncbi:hypothetical protein [Plantactinospora sp. BC1]|uniref:hypothetical protein n=1 Tax=Plantactinospora sp. BC1 TaxID=2108470 RepID=UPI00131EF3FB|nr:hypothetical protein [Plantactinospora sp. BC1]
MTELARRADYRWLDQQRTVACHMAGDEPAADGNTPPSDTHRRRLDAVRNWHEALQQLITDEEDARAWRRARSEFAQRLGLALVRATDRQGPVHGPVLYGVWLRAGLLYVGQTANAQRRLRDLPIGESHHLANTFPPEIWHRVLVVMWPALPEAASIPDDISPTVAGLALEHRLQEWLRPLANSEHRTRQGGWRPVAFDTSQSQGAKAAPRVDHLFRAVQEIWQAAASADADADADAIRHPAVRCVEPAAFLPSILGSG